MDNDSWKDTVWNIDVNKLQEQFENFQKTYFCHFTDPVNDVLFELDKADEIVNNMSEYPEALKMIEKCKK